MAQIKVNYLKVGKHGHYSDGQSLVEKENAMMPASRVNYYLADAEHRGLDFFVETGVIDVDDADVDGYVFHGYEIISF
jgi:hypothetical protein